MENERGPFFNRSALTQPTIRPRWPASIIPMVLHRRPAGNLANGPVVRATDEIHSSGLT
jgi:hypothetical protein